MGHWLWKWEGVESRRMRLMSRAQPPTSTSRPLVPSPLGRFVPQLTNPGDTQQRFTAILRPKIQPLTFLGTIF